MRVPPVENPTCAAFEEYEEVPETVPLDFTEDDITWVPSKLSGAAGALGAEAMELRNWLLRFGCTSEELRIVVENLADWMANSSPPWAAYRALMACRLVALDKRPGVLPMGIGETLSRALAKLVMRAAGEQAKTAWVSPSMPASRPAHSWRLLHAVFACSPAALMTSLARARQSVSLMPTGRTLGLLSNTTRRQAISAR